MTGVQTCALPICLDKELPAIGRNRRAGDEARIIGGQEGDAARDLFRLAQTAHRNQRDDALVQHLFINRPTAYSSAGIFYLEDTMTETEKAVLVENMLLMRKEDFDELLDSAAERGAERCLAHLGLENGSAAKDIRDLRDLLEAWRDARRTAWQTAVKVITTGVLAVLLVGTAIKLKIMGGGQ